MTLVRDKDIGGGFVRRGFSMGGARVTSGQHLSREQVLAMPGANRQALITNGYIDVYPPTAADLDPPQRFVASKGFGKFDVYEGHRLNAEPLTRDEAEALAGGKMPEAPETD